MIRNWLPHFLRAPLWGDRDKWGLVVRPDDACWKEWKDEYINFYTSNQRRGIGGIVNDAGYRVMSEINLDGKRVLEIGPGDIRHVSSWRGKPSEFLLADIRPSMLSNAEKKLEEAGVGFNSILVSEDKPLSLEEGSVDVVVSFYSLEHIYPLAPYLEEINRALRSGGVLIGAIPTEGGIAWGLGRMLTSRRWFKKNTNIDPDKIICWEHPNFADEIITDLDRNFDREILSLWPFPWLPMLDANLVIRFLYRKRK